MIELLIQNKNKALLLRLLPIFLLLGLFLLETMGHSATTTITETLGTGVNAKTYTHVVNTKPVYQDPNYYLFRIDTPAVGELYFIIFNGISSLFDSVGGSADGAGNYLSLLKLSFMAGGFVMFAMAVGKTMKDGSHAGLVDFMKYLIIGTALLFLMFGSKSNLIVRSDSFSSYCDNGKTIYTIGELQSGIDSSTGNPIATDAYSGFVVGNFPTLLGWTFSTMNSIGYQLTVMARTVFSDTSGVVTGLKQANGSNEYASYLGGVNALLTTNIEDLLKNGDINTTYPQASVTSNWADITTSQALGPYFRSFMKTCVFMVNSTDPNVGTKIAEAIESTSNFAETMNDIFTTGNIVIYKGFLTNVTTKTIGKAQLADGGTVATKIFNEAGASGTCGDFWTDVIYASITNVDSDKLMCSPALAGKVDKGALYMLTGNANVPGGNAAELAINSGLFSMYGGMKNGGYVAEDISYAAGKSKADFVMNNVGTGMYMAQMLPYLQMGIRAVLYAFFPFVFVVILLPGGVQVLISYLSTLLWVELWTPVAAILNLFLGSITLSKFSSAFKQDGFSPGSALNILSDSAMLASVGGYLYASVPALTWLVLKGSGQMLGSITGGMAGGYASHLASANINRDAEMLKKREMVNDFTHSQTGKFLSMAEVEQSQAIAQGIAKGAEIGTLAQANGGTLSGYTNAHRFIGKKGGNALVTSQVEGKNLTTYNATTTGAKNVENTKSTTTEMQMKDIMDSNGNINMNKLQQVANVQGTEAVKTYLKSKEVQDAHGGQTRQSAATIAKNIAIGENAGMDANAAIGYATLKSNNINAASLSAAQYKQMISDFGSVSNFGRQSQESQNNAVLAYGKTKNQLQEMGYKNPRELMQDMNALQDTVKTSGQKMTFDEVKSDLQRRHPNEKITDNRVRTLMAGANAVPAATSVKAFEDKKVSPSTSVKDTIRDISTVESTKDSADYGAEKNIQQDMGKEKYKKLKEAVVSGEYKGKEAVIKKYAELRGLPTTGKDWLKNAANDAQTREGFQKAANQAITANVQDEVPLPEQVKTDTLSKSGDFTKRKSLQDSLGGKKGYLDFQKNAGKGQASEYKSQVKSFRKLNPEFKSDEAAFTEMKRLAGIQNTATAEQIKAISGKNGEHIKENVAIDGSEQKEKVENRKAELISFLVGAKKGEVETSRTKIKENIENTLDGIDDTINELETKKRNLAYDARTMVQTLPFTKEQKRNQERILDDLENGKINREQATEQLIETGAVGSSSIFESEAHFKDRIKKDFIDKKQTERYIDKQIKKAKSFKKDFTDVDLDEKVETIHQSNIKKNRNIKQFNANIDQNIKKIKTADQKTLAQIARDYGSRQGTTKNFISDDNFSIKLQVKQDTKEVVKASVDGGTNNSVQVVTKALAEGGASWETQKEASHWINLTEGSIQKISQIKMIKGWTK